MPYTIYAAPRLTWRYRDGWAHEDQWGNPQRFKVLAPRVTRHAEEYDEVDTVLYRVIGDKRADQKLQAKALNDYFSGSSCRHEYDCCGCVSTYASVRRVKPGIFSVLVSGTRNY